VRNQRVYRPSVREKALSQAADLAREKAGSRARDEKDTTVPEAKKKDGWDKAGVVASILGSVVLASLTLVLNSTIQKTQTKLQKQQVDAAAQNAKREERNQNAKATTDLIQYLMSGEPATQRIALMALREAVQDDDDLVIDVVSVVASTSTNASVYATATDTLEASHNPRVAKILADIAFQKASVKDPGSILAYRAAQRVGVQATAENGTTIIYGAPPGGVVFESAASGGGVFTQALISTLLANPGPVTKGVLDLDALHDILDQTIARQNSLQPMPFIISSGASNIPIWAPASAEVLSIGVSKYLSKDLPSLRYPASDADAFSNMMHSHGATTKLLTDAAATKDAVLRNIDGFSKVGDGNGTFVLYFSGHGWNTRGIQQLAASDMRPRHPTVAVAPQSPDGTQARGTMIEEPDFEGSIALSDIMQRIGRLPFRFKLVIIDACSTASS
jgi:hypothetical protein